MTTPKKTTAKKPTTRKTTAKRKATTAELKQHPVEVTETPEGKIVQVHFGFKASDTKKVAWTFIQAFGGTFTTGTATSALHSVPEAKVAVFSGIAAGVAAAISAAKNFILDDSSPLK